MVELELKLEPSYSPQAANAPRGQVNCLHLGLDKLHMTKDATDRIDNVARIKISRGDFVQHRREQNEVLTIDKPDLYVRTPSDRLVEVHRRAQSGKSTSQNNNASLLHSSSPSCRAHRQ